MIANFGKERKHKDFWIARLSCSLFTRIICLVALIKTDEACAPASQLMQFATIPQRPTWDEAGGRVGGMAMEKKDILDKENGAILFKNILDAWQDIDPDLDLKYPFTDWSYVYTGKWSIMMRDDPHVHEDRLYQN